MKKLFELTEKADYCLKNNKNPDISIINELSDIVSNSGFIGIAQINTRSGDFEYNSNKIAKYIKFAENIGLECIVFPEYALTGYEMKDVFYRHKKLYIECEKWLNGLAKLTKNTIAIVGSVDFFNNEFLACSKVLKSGKVQSNMTNNPIIFDKYILLSGKNYESVLQDSSSTKSKLLINCASLTYKQYRSFWHSSISSKYNAPTLFVNQVGANDNTLFEGISSLCDSNGQLVARAKAFEEQLMIVNPSKNIGKIYSLPKGYDESLQEQNKFSLDYEYDMERTYKALVLGIKDYFAKCGLKRAVLGLSGGLDSTVCAVLLADALGKENVLGVSMPSHITTNESKSDAEQLAHNLGIKFVVAPIKNIVDTINKDFKDLFNNIENQWENRNSMPFTTDNVQARSRATILWGISNEFSSCIPIATSDKSEAYMGYATINGDMSGGYAPIADITKTKLFALARWLNKNRDVKNVIPESIILKRPGAELAINPKTGKPLIAEDALMPYEFLDEVIWRIENKHESYDDMLDSEFIYEKEHVICREQKIEWLDKFYNRMSRAFYKWSIMPPTVMTEPISINMIDYKQLITSSHINYKGVSEEYISESLK